MNRLLKCGIGIGLIAAGLMIKMVFSHNMHYWALVQTASVALFIAGMAIVATPLYLSDGKAGTFQEDRLGWAWRKVSRLGLVLLLLAAVMGLGKFGTYLNYRLRHYYLSFDTGHAIGYSDGIEKVSIVRGGEASFYVVSFEVAGEWYRGGLLTRYAERDNLFFDRFAHPQPGSGALTVETLQAHQFTVEFSKRHPSFFRIVE